MKGLAFFRNWGTQDLLLIPVLLIGFILRLYNLGEFSMTNDEMTALVQTNVADLATLYETNKIGVHPFGYYFFLFYWIKLFGNDPWILRLPFVLMGMGSIFIIYRIGLNWFNKTTALFTATCLSFLTFPVLYSQLARPYSPGLFLSLLAIWYWTKIVFPADRKEITWSTYIGFIFAAWGAAMMHYFALMLVGVVGLTGFMFIDRRSWKYYILCGVVILLLYIPFSPIFINHLGRSGLDWLGRPYPDFLLNFIIYVFNKDYLLLYIFALSISVLIWQSRKRLNWSPFHTICLILFMVPFLLAYIKSVTGKPILQERALIFELPFLILLLCSFYVPQGRASKQLVQWLPAWGVFAASCLISFFFRVDYYNKGLDEFGNFKAISHKAAEYYVKHKEQVTLTANVNRPFYLQYYPQKQRLNLPFKLYRTDDIVGLDSLQLVTSHSRTPYLFYCWSHLVNSPAASHIIRTKYPVIVDNEQHEQYGYSLYHTGQLHGDTIFHISNNIDSIPSAGWENVRPSRQQAYSGQVAAKLNGEEFGLGYTTTAGKLAIQKGDKLLINCKVLALAQPSTAVLVLDIGGEKKVWKGSAISDYVYEAAKWDEVWLMHEFDQMNPADAIKIYLYNPQGEILYADDMDILIVRER